MTAGPLRVCVTGPESTGKTTLARRLAEWAGAPWVPEASRVYAEGIGRALTAEDVGPIARLAIDLSDEGVRCAAREGAPIVVLDTDLLSTVVYARHYYGRLSRSVQAAERLRRADLYLLCDVDVPWVGDGIRDRPSDRKEMFALFERALARRRARVNIIRGDWDARWLLARRAMAALRGTSPDRA